MSAASVRSVAVWLSVPEAFWTPDDTCLRPFAHGPEARPVASWLPVRVRGRSSLLTRMLAEVVEQAADPTRPGASGGLRDVACVFGSGWGELNTMQQLLDMMCREDGALSPARFQASVHNTSAGLLSIAGDQQGFSTSLAAGPETVAACFEEALALLHSEAEEVLLAMGDEPLPAFVANGGMPLAIAVGMRLGRVPAAADLARVQFCPAPLPSPGGAEAARVACNPIAAALPIVQRLLEGGDGAVRLTPEGSRPAFLQLQGTRRS